MTMAVRLAYSNTRYSSPPPRIAFPPPAPIQSSEPVTLVEFLHRAQLFGVRQNLPRNHTLFAEGGKIGPDLTGYDRRAPVLGNLYRAAWQTLRPCSCGRLDVRPRKPRR